MDLKKWYDNNSFIYKNFELKGAFLTTLYLESYSNKKNSLFYFLRNTKWKVLSFIKNNNYYVNNFKNIENLNAYIINFDPEDNRHFDHIKGLVEKDKNALILTISSNVYDYYKESKPVVLFNVKYKNNYYIKEKYYEKNKLPKKYNFIKNRALSLIDLLICFEKEHGLPKKIISLQDFHMYDYIFTQFYKGRITTITLQHGAIFGEGILWKFIFSDYIIVWGEKPKRQLINLGIPQDKIKALGTAKYDQYLKYKQIKKRTNGRILFSIQPLLTKEFINSTINFIYNFINNSSYNIWIRYHPAVKKKYKKKNIQFLQKKKVNK